MKLVYTAFNSTEAHILSHMLQAEGIESNLNGEILQGAIGGIPADNYIKVFVNDDNFDKAEKITKEFEDRNTKPLEKEVKTKGNKSMLFWVAFIFFGLGYIFSQIPDISSHTSYIDRIVGCLTPSKI